MKKLKYKRIHNYLRKLTEAEKIIYVKNYLHEVYKLQEEMPEDFYELISIKLCSDDYISIFDTIKTNDLYALISYLRYNDEDTKEFKKLLTPKQYYETPRRIINEIIKELKSLRETNKGSTLHERISNETIWLLKKNPNYSNEEYLKLAYKIYLSIGIDNATKILREKELDYEKVHFLFNNIDTKKQVNSSAKESLNNFLFANYSSDDNIIKEILHGDNIELFLNFDYLFNNIERIINILGESLSKTGVIGILGERFLSKNVVNPEISSDIVKDIISSYYHKYGISEKEEEVLEKNYKAYNEILKKKTKSSIPQIDVIEENGLKAAIIDLNSPKNLVMGYRSGNCFRINGDASILFKNFLSNPHMRLVSISNKKYTDYAMMLIMRNGNVLISQGIEASKRVPESLKGEKLYNLCRKVMKRLMDYMNNNNDEIVATIIGSTNSSVSRFNNNIVPFIVTPIMSNKTNYYNGVDNYQCLLDLKYEGALKDIKLFEPQTSYQDKRPSILTRSKTNHDHYQEIEKILISLRAKRFKEHTEKENAEYYKGLVERNEVFTVCNIDWHITVFDDGTMETYIEKDNEKAANEYRCIFDQIKDALQSKIARRRIYK